MIGKKKLMKSACALIAFSVIITAGGPSRTETDSKKAKETALFKVSPGNKILGPASELPKNMKLQFVSVTTDQPVYWPNEEVYLKVLMPLKPSEKIKMSIQKKDATPSDKTLKLNDGGMLVEKIMDGTKKKLETGEYSVQVKTMDDKIKASASFTVVEGSLGALSFAYDFKDLTKAEELKEAKGGWFLGNAEGVGKRWGNGLNVKNEIRAFNKPFSGTATIMSRCYLPGCNGVEAGQPVTQEIKDGLLEVFMEVGGHSGPFEIEVITDKGSLRYLFERSGHVERQTVSISSGLTRKFHATLAPYAGTEEVRGRGIFIEEKKETSPDALELPTPICPVSGKMKLKVKQALANPRLYAFTTKDGEAFDHEEVSLGSKLAPGDTIDVPCRPPYTFLAVGGFPAAKKKDFYEGWAVLFPESALDVEVTLPGKGGPLQETTVQIRTLDRAKGKGVSMYGILEVFDNRVPSKSGHEPLVSATGDSIRPLSNYLTTWVDKTGIPEKKEKDKEVKKYKKSKAPSIKAGAASVGGKGAGMLYSFDDDMSEMAAPAPKQAAPKRDGVPSTGVEPEDELFEEPIREGEKKVVYCGLVKTDGNGLAEVNVKLPPQTGRCNARFVAVRGFDYLEKIETIDVHKGDSVEADLQPLLIPGAKVKAGAHVTNSGKENVVLKIWGAGIGKALSMWIKPGTHIVPFDVTGGKYGTMFLKVADKAGKTLDLRKIKISNVASMPVTYSDVVLSDGSQITVPKGRKVAIYQNPAMLLGGMVTNVTTTLYSWFGHSEALSASCAVRAILLRAMEEKIIDDEGHRDTLAADLKKTVKDLDEAFFDRDKKLFRPYPGMEASETWSLWTSRNLSDALAALEGSKNLKKEFSDTVARARAMVKDTNGELKKRSVKFNEDAFYDPDSGQDVIPIEVNGKVLYKLVTDDAVVKWYVDNMMPVLDIPTAKKLGDLNARIIKAYDLHRFLKAFERTGHLYYLILNAKALYLKKDKNFMPLFNQIARGLIFTKDPGLIQGPALLGGVYSGPSTFVKFLDLLVAMAGDKKIKGAAKVEITAGGQSRKEKISGDPLIVQDKKNAVTIKADAYATLRIDDTRSIKLYDYLENKAFFKVKVKHSKLKVGAENVLSVVLDKDKDASEYYAIIAAPSVLSIRQTDDLLSDYKGQLIYGQKTGGGERIQLVTAPFRGSGTMTLKLEGAIPGTSKGYVLVRHISNPEIIAAVEIDTITVK